MGAIKRIIALPPTWPLYRLEEEEIVEGLGAGAIMVRASAMHKGMKMFATAPISERMAEYEWGLERAREKAVAMLTEQIGHEEASKPVLPNRPGSRIKAAGEWLILSDGKWWDGCGYFTPTEVELMGWTQP